MNIKSIGKKGSITGLLVLTMLIGATGASVIKISQTSAQTPTPTTAVVNTTAETPSSAPDTDNIQDNKPDVQNGTFKSNENSAHETNESIAREAQEDAGQRPTVK